MTTTRTCDKCGEPNSGTIQFVDKRGLCADCAKETITREAYMAGEISHDAYYLGIAAILGLDTITALVQPVIEGRTLADAGDHLNGIQLRRWDALDGPVRRLVAAKSAEVMAASWGGTPFEPGRYCWSLSETVCTTKAVARQILEKREEDSRGRR